MGSRSAPVQHNSRIRQAQAGHSGGGLEHPADDGGKKRQQQQGPALAAAAQRTKRLGANKMQQRRSEQKQRAKQGRQKEEAYKRDKKRINKLPIFTQIRIRHLAATLLHISTGFLNFVNNFGQFCKDIGTVHNA